MASVRSRGAMLRLLRRASPHEQTAASSPMWGSLRGCPSFGSHGSVVNPVFKISTSGSGRDENGGAHLVRLRKDTGLATLLSDVRGMSTQARVPTQALGQATKDVKHANLLAIRFPVLTMTRNGGYTPLPNLNQGSSFFLSRRYVSTSVATGTNPPGEYETRGRLCKTLVKRNIMDHKRRLLAAKYELKRKLYKALCRDPDLPSDMREKHRYKLSELPRNSSFGRLRNRCIFTGRARAVLKMFRMSRIVFREKACEGSLMGVKKSSW